MNDNATNQKPLVTSGVFMGNRPFAALAELHQIIPHGEGHAVVSPGFEANDKKGPEGVRPRRNQRFRLPFRPKIRRK